MRNYDKNLGTVHVSVATLTKDERVPDLISTIIGSGTPRVATARTKGECADFLVTRGKLTANLERQAARLAPLDGRCIPVVMPEGAGYLADKLLAATAAGNDVRVYITGGES